jgi:hypothetical protein
VSKTVIRYFFDFLDGQEKWLNQMANHGYRLKKCGVMTYTFDQCMPEEYEYAVEFVGDNAYSKIKDYRVHLEDMGFRTFSKNINLNFSYGKVRWRPYAKGMGQIATSPGGYNKELLILEKKRDGTPFNLHSNMQDKLETCKQIQSSYMWAVFMMLLLIIMTFIPDVFSMSFAMTWAIRAILFIFGILFMIPATNYWKKVKKLKEETNIYN